MNWDGESYAQPKRGAPPKQPKLQINIRILETYEPLLELVLQFYKSHYDYRQLAQPNQHPRNSERLWTPSQLFMKFLKTEFEFIYKENNEWLQNNNTFWHGVKDIHFKEANNYHKRVWQNKTKEDQQKELDDYFKKLKEEVKE